MSKILASDFLSHRDAIRESLKGGELKSAIARLKQFWSVSPNLQVASFVNAELGQQKQELFSKKKVFVLRSSTIEPIIPLFRASGYLLGFELDVTVGDFNTYQQEVLDPSSLLYSSSPDYCILALDSRGIAQDVWFDGSTLDESTLRDRVSSISDRLIQLIQTFRNRTDAHLIVHGLEVPHWETVGLQDSRRDFSLRDAFEGVNASIRGFVRSQSNTYFLDIDRVARSVGYDNWCDTPKWVLARTATSSTYIPKIANEWMKILCATTPAACKVIVTDLDNTLWGGVIGEDGLEGIKIDPEYPGYAFQAVQRCLKEFKSDGGLLAITSKNNERDALKVFDEHPGMILKKTDFAAMRINWEEKHQNLRSISEELNLGLDSFVFIDDNPVERDAIRKFLPDVDVLELPRDPNHYASTIRDNPRFAKVIISGEDKQRNQLYIERKNRDDAVKSAESIDAFYHSLNQVVRVVSTGPLTLPRIAQLTQKTNQFNLTTRRYSETEILTGIEQSNWDVLGIQVTDSFGDNGIVGVVILKPITEEDWEIDTFLMSCRVIGRKVETAMLAVAMNRLSTRGCKRVEGWFLPTAKNDPCKDFYELHGFHKAGESASGTRNLLEMNRYVCKVPSWIKIEEN